jgi:hypothetical protein
VTARIWVEPVRHSDGRPKYNSRGQLYRTVLVAPMARCWSGYLAIVIVSLVPGSLRPHIHGFPSQLEYFLAYGAVGSAYGLAYSSTDSRVVSGL